MYRHVTLSTAMEDKVYVKRHMTLYTTMKARGICAKKCDFAYKHGAQPCMFA